MANIFQQPKRNIVEQQQEKLAALSQKSIESLDIVTTPTR